MHINAFYTKGNNLSLKTLMKISCSLLLYRIKPKRQSRYLCYPLSFWLKCSAQKTVFLSLIFFFLLSLILPFHILPLPPFSFITRWTAQESPPVWETALLFSPQQCYTISSRRKSKETLCSAWFLMQQVIEWCNFFPKKAFITRWVIQGFKRRVHKNMRGKHFEGH